MKRITIFAAGSQGDIQPCVSLGVGLKKAGFQVVIAAPEDFEEFIQNNQLKFFPLRGDVQKIMASDTGRQFMEAGGNNPFRSIQAMRKLIAPVIKRMVEDAYKACLDADGIICQGVFSPFGQSIAEALDIPIINIEPTPLLPTKVFPAPSWPIQRNLGSAHNYISGFAMIAVIWMWYQPFVNEFRKNLGLLPCSAASYYKIFKATPMLCAYSQSIIKHPIDWPSDFNITGYFFLEAKSEWQPSARLIKFLEDGDPPVYIGFGSMGGKNPENLANIAIEALAQCGQRGLILTGWGGLQTKSIPDNVFVLDSAPHSWLFPQMSALVHHGGAGTTAEGLRAGVPTVIIPFIFDQFFWGAQVKAMGLGPNPIPYKILTADRLADAIRTAISDPNINKQAKRCGEIIRKEKGIQNALEFIKLHLG